MYEHRGEQDANQWHVHGRRYIDTWGTFEKLLARWQRSER